MNVLWQRLYTRAVIWLVGEIFLTLIGLDTLADYGEFLLGEAVNPQILEPPAISLAIN